MWLFAKTWGVRILATMWLISNCKINKNGAIAKALEMEIIWKFMLSENKGIKCINDKANYNMHILTNWKIQLILKKYNYKKI